MAKEKNKTIKEAEKEVKYLTGDAEIQRLAELRERWEMDRIDAISRAAEEAAKEAAEIGLRQGMEQGIKQGIEQGIEQEKIEIAKNMLKEKMPIEVIIKITSLTREDIEKIKTN